MSKKSNWFLRIVAWNHERGLIAKGFNHLREISFIIEELLESTGKYDSKSARKRAEKIAADIVGDGVVVPAAHIVDAFADIIVFATGTIAKLGYDPAQVMEEVYREIDSRKGTIIDGKFVTDLTVKTYEANFESCRT